MRWAVIPIFRIEFSKPANQLCCKIHIANPIFLDFLFLFTFRKKRTASPFLIGLMVMVENSDIIELFNDHLRDSFNVLDAPSQKSILQ